jgi:hypothetical protein
MRGGVKWGRPANVIAGFLNIPPLSTTAFVIPFTAKMFNHPNLIYFYISRYDISMLLKILIQWNRTKT